ncbi:primase-associated protein [Halodesulfurarchaeum sp. HSR-GB]|uniref:primase-associated protein n=1 Tax=Halodesulfurarchaeum sp. HSR-GB TaxID=3074077 RepID=UPI0028626C0E|nr:primase-associated protein [Halodesulfurarchaeum sp. HSR-GB]MDR5657620.1 primase-associated protein [Halodesulfurarchaeum sp. HSR-GB]
MSSNLVENTTDAIQIAASPAEQPEMAFEQVLSKAVGRFGKTRNPKEKLAQKVDEFGVEALYNHTSKLSVAEYRDIVVRDPLQLMIRAGFATIVMENHDRVSGIPNEYIKLSDYVANEYARSITGLIDADEYEIDEEWIYDVIGDRLYASSSPKKETHPGTVISRTDATFEDKAGKFVEIPLISASPKALIYASDNSWEGKFNQGNGQVEGELHSFVRNNNLYVPFRHLKWKHYHTLADDFEVFVNWLQDKITSGELQHLLENTPKIDSEIEGFYSRNKKGAVVTGWTEDEQLIRVLTTVLEDSNLDENAPHSASKLHKLTNHYTLEDWQQAIVNQITSPKQLGKKLTSIAKNSGSSNVTIQENEEGTRNEYIIGQVGRDTRRLAVNELEDLFELPCFNNLDERLKNKGPTRWELYSLVRTISWLPEYYDNDFGDTLEDIKDLFSRWSWYDPAETEYQVQYELTGSNNLGLMDADAEVLPLNCNNENWEANYCIGADECPYYTMYSALPFHQDLYDQLDDGND